MRWHILLIVLIIAPMLLLGGCGGDGGGSNGEDTDRDRTESSGEDFSWLEKEQMAGILGLDDPEWRNYPDLEAEKAAIGQTVAGFAEALRQGDSDTAVQFIQSEKQEAYKFLFDENSEAMSSFGGLIEQAQISFLSEHDPYEAYNRTAEYAIEHDGYTFYVVFMKEDDHWVLYDF